MMSAGVYRFVISDYLNPLALPMGGPGSGVVYVYQQTAIKVAYYESMSRFIYVIIPLSFDHLDLLTNKYILCKGPIYPSGGSSQSRFKAKTNINSTRRLSPVLLFSCESSSNDSRHPGYSMRSQDFSAGVSGC